MASLFDLSSKPEFDAPFAALIGNIVVTDHSEEFLGYVFLRSDRFIELQFLGSHDLTDFGLSLRTAEISTDLHVSDRLGRTVGHVLSNDSSSSMLHVTCSSSPRDCDPWFISLI